MADRGTFEWVAGWEELRDVLSPSRLGLPTDARVVDIGCGTSTLPLHLATMYGRVTGADREPHCAASMSAMHSESDALRWVTCDVTATDTAALEAVLPEGSAELVVDKGTLDCALTEDEAAPLLCNVARLLSGGGVYVVVSFRKRELLVPLLSCEALPWTVEHVPLLPASGVGAPSSVCIMRKRLAASEDGDGGGGGGSLPSARAVVAEHLQAVSDWWYQQEAPMLTADREAELREAWSAAMRQLRSSVASAVGATPPTPPPPCDSLPLALAFEVLFTPSERAEIGFDGFVSDLVDGGAGGEEGSDDDDDVAMAHAQRRGADMPTSISLEEALAYLRRDQ